MAVIFSSKTSVPIRATQHYIPEDSNIQAITTLGYFMTLYLTCGYKATMRNKSLVCRMPSSGMWRRVVWFGVVSQKTELFIVTAVKTSNSTERLICCKTWDMHVVGLGRELEGGGVLCPSTMSFSWISTTNQHESHKDEGSVQLAEQTETILKHEYGLLGFNFLFSLQTTSVTTHKSVFLTVTAVRTSCRIYRNRRVTHERQVVLISEL
jgi:hypothetical protein